VTVGYVAAVLWVDLGKISSQIRTCQPVGWQKNACLPTALCRKCMGQIRQIPFVITAARHYHHHESFPLGFVPKQVNPFLTFATNFCEDHP